MLPTVTQKSLHIDTEYHGFTSYYKHCLKQLWVNYVVIKTVFIYHLTWHHTAQKLHSTMYTYTK